MCMVKPPKPTIVEPAPLPPPVPPPPPPPEATAQDLRIGSDRQSAPSIKNFLRNSINAKRNSLVIPLGGIQQAGAGGSGLNI